MTPRIDLYSDTHTKPTPEMRQAMMEAEVGDEQQFEDPTVNKLCEMVAALLGQEAAVFLPSGTMCNQIAFRVHCQPGDEIILDYTAHPITAESGGPGVPPPHTGVALSHTSSDPVYQCLRLKAVHARGLEPLRETHNPLQFGQLPTAAGTHLQVAIHFLAALRRQIVIQVLNQRV